MAVADMIPIGGGGDGVVILGASTRERLTLHAADGSAGGIDLLWAGGDYWSPEGGRIAYGWHGPACAVAGPASLRIMDVSTGEVSVVIEDDATMAPLRWSPDGSRILFIQPNAEGSASSTWRVDTDGSDRALSQGPRTPPSPSAESRSAHEAAEPIGLDAGWLKDRRRASAPHRERLARLLPA